MKRSLKVMLIVGGVLQLFGCEKSPSEQCLDSFRMYLTDPESGKALSFRINSDENKLDKILYHETGVLSYSATNSYGARVQNYADCAKKGSQWQRVRTIYEELAVTTRQVELSKQYRDCTFNNKMGKTYTDCGYYSKYEDFESTAASDLGIPDYP